MLETKREDDQHCGKSVQIRTFLWSVYFCIQFEYNKKRNGKNSGFGHFSRSAKGCLKSIGWIQAE